MLRATFLGHHAWLYASDQARVLVDPLFNDRFGLTDAVELRSFPPRTLDFAAFPAVDAVFLTHEHEGHFDIPSLNRLDRRIPVLMSTRSSLAMRQILGEMGFRLRLLYPGEPVEVGDLELLPVTGDQVNLGLIEEWDVLAYLVRDRAGDGSLFAQVDLPLVDSMWQTLRPRLPHVTAWAYTNNHSEWAFTYSWARAEPRRLRHFVREITGYHERMTQNWAPPATTLVVGGGYAFGGARDWLNRNVFTVSCEDVAEVLARLLPGDRVLAPLPGQTLVMKDGRVAEVEERTAFATTRPRSDWPARGFQGDVTWLETYPPVTGRHRLERRELPALERELAGLAQHLYGRAEFRKLYSLSAGDLGGRKPTIALALRADERGAAYVFEYVPQASAFVPVECADPASEYLGVFECWATDLLAFLRCEISSTSLCFGHARLWNAAPATFHFDFHHPVFEYVHPLRMTERCLAQYRRALAAAPRPARKIGFAGAQRRGAGASRSSRRRRSGSKT